MDRYLEDKSRLHIQLLGSFRLSLDGNPITDVDSPRLQGLLAYLLLHRTGPASRQQVAFLFWPETNERQARTNLRTLLHRLYSAWPEANQYILTDGQSLAWNLDAAYVLDVAEFERSVAAQDWQPAIDLYGGDLLPDLYQDWVLDERERLEQLVIYALEKQIGWLASDEQPAEAIQLCQHLLRRDPLREETYRQLMRLYSAQGELTGVIRTYEACLEVLSRQLDVQPSPETQAEFLLCSQAGPASTAHADLIRGNLPAALDQIIGRAEATEQIERLVLSHRLVTLTGFGGVGKTRLAMDAARKLKDNFPAGVWLLDLSRLSDPTLIPQAATAIFSVRELEDCQLIECLVDFLYRKRVLLVVDNCEHLLDSAAQFILRLLEGCPELHILATSRVSLRLAGEIVYPTPPLSLPAEVLSSETSASAEEEGEPAAKRLTLSESEQLFLQRATALMPDFRITPLNRRAVAQVCRRLNGIPLAIELAAARVNTLTVEQIASRLDSALKLLRYSNPTGLPRHQTLQATLDWSHALLSTPEQNLLHRMSVFAGSFSLASAEAAASGEIEPGDVLDLLSSLIDHSLITLETAAEVARYRLHEVTRQYAWEKLTQAGKQEQVLLSHLEYYCDLAERAEPMLTGSEQITWLKLLDLEKDNLRAALRWGTRQQPIVAGKTLRLVGALWFYWFVRGRYVEGLYWTEKALAAAQTDNNQPSAWGKALYAAASFTLFMGHLPEAEDYSQASLAACRALHDLAGEVISLHHLGALAMRVGNEVQARSLLVEGLDKANLSGDGWLVCILQIDLGILAIQQERWASAYQHFQESLSIARQNGDRFSIHYALFNLAGVAIQLGKLAQAAAFNRQAAILCRETNDVRGEAICLANDADLSARQGQIERARQLYQDSLALFWDIRDRENTLTTLEGVAVSSLKLGEADKIIQILSACQAVRQHLGIEPLPFEQSRVTAAISSLRAEINEHDFVIAWSAGQLLDLEEAVELAMQF